MSYTIGTLCNQENQFYTIILYFYRVYCRLHGSVAKRHSHQNSSIALNLTQIDHPPKVQQDYSTAEGKYYTIPHVSYANKVQPSTKDDAHANQENPTYTYDTVFCNNIIYEAACDATEGTTVHNGAIHTDVHNDACVGISSCATEFRITKVMTTANHKMISKMKLMKRNLSKM